MNSLDLVTILGNLSQSLFPVQHLITGGAYLLGLIFIITALHKLKEVGSHRSHSSSQEKVFPPLMYLVFGIGLLYLPNTMSTLANTAFGVGNVLTYSSYNQGDIYSTMGVIVRTAGLIWFIRGSVLLVHASQPGVQEGPKGLLFIIAGILAMNFDNTISMVNHIMEYLVTWALNFKVSQGY